LNIVSATLTRSRARRQATCDRSEALSAGEQREQPDLGRVLADCAGPSPSWSSTVYDNQSRSILDTPQRYPSAGSQGYPSPAADLTPIGSTTISFGPILLQGGQTVVRQPLLR
jgi:hypothetical protein